MSVDCSKCGEFISSRGTCDHPCGELQIRRVKGACTYGDLFHPVGTILVVDERPEE